MHSLFIIMGRKRKQGKARRAAKAKAREEAQESRGRNSQTTEAEAVLRCINEPGAGGKKCFHGAGCLSQENSGSFLFLCAFREVYQKAIERSTDTKSSLAEATRATRVPQFEEVWKDFTKMKMVITLFLMLGANNLLGGKYDTARKDATCARYFEQYIAVELHQTQAVYKCPKIGETYIADKHTLVKFFRHRIPCSCLDEMYEEVKSIAKMGFCNNLQCSIPGRRVERSKTKYCSRCRCATYCSRECQVADWPEHKPYCDKFAALIAKFEAKRKRQK